MKIIPLRIAGVAAAAGLLLSVLRSSVQAQDQPLLGATLTFANGETLFLKAKDRFQSIALAPGEAVSIAVQLPLLFANAPASAQALDGGQLSADDIVIAEDGTAALEFQAGAPPGRYRLLLGSMGKSATLQFQVVEQ